MIVRSKLSQKGRSLMCTNYSYPFRRRCFPRLWLPYGTVEYPWANHASKPAENHHSPISTQPSAFPEVPDGPGWLIRSCTSQDMAVLDLQITMRADVFPSRLDSALSPLSDTTIDQPHLVIICYFPACCDLIVSRRTQLPIRCNFALP